MQKPTSNPAVIRHSRQSYHGYHNSDDMLHGVSHYGMSQHVPAHTNMHHNGSTSHNTLQHSTLLRGPPHRGAAHKGHTLLRQMSAPETSTLRPPLPTTPTSPSKGFAAKRFSKVKKLFSLRKRFFGKTTSVRSSLS